MARRRLTGHCAVDGCDRPMEDLIWCHGHYERQRRGDPLGGPFLDTHEKRFWAKVDATGPHLLWTGAKGGNGRYGMFSYQGRNRPAHRVAWLLAGNPDPAPGYDLDHLCRVTLCVDVSHLEVVTHRENILRGESWQAKNARKTHCIRGHEFTPENTYVMARGGRSCRACEAIRAPLKAERRRQRYIASQDRAAA